MPVVNLVATYVEEGTQPPLQAGFPWYAIPLLGVILVAGYLASRRGGKKRRR